MHDIIVLFFLCTVWHSMDGRVMMMLTWMMKTLLSLPWAAWGLLVGFWPLKSKDTKSTLKV